MAVVNGVMGTYSILLGKGDGTFQPAATYAAGGTRYQASVAAGDFNGDGKPDLALASGSVIILLGNGDGTFRALPAIPFANLPKAIAVADFNGDGKQDLAVAHGDISILIGHGDGTFEQPVQYPAQGTSIAIADFNGDGKPDLALAGGESLGTVPILLGNGDGTFQSGFIYFGGQLTNLMVAGDFNGDGKPDLVSSAYDAVYLLTNTTQ